MKITRAVSLYPTRFIREIQGDQEPLEIKKALDAKQKKNKKREKRIKNTTRLNDISAEGGFKQRASVRFYVMLSN